MHLFQHLLLFSLVFSLPNLCHQGQCMMTMMTMSTSISIVDLLQPKITKITAISVFKNSQIIPRFKLFPQKKLSQLSVGSHRRSGKEFHKAGPATEKARRRPNVLSR